MTLLAEAADSQPEADTEAEAKVSDAAPSVLSALASLEQQCRIFQRSAQELGEPVRAKNKQNK